VQTNPKRQEIPFELTKTLDKLIPGFVGIPKGALQIAYERGFIDASQQEKRRRQDRFLGRIDHQRY
jgi:hypothetical protein